MGDECIKTQMMPLIHSFNKYVLNTCSVSCVFGIGGINNMDKVSLVALRLCQKDMLRKHAQYCVVVMNRVRVCLDRWRSICKKAKGF
jgi:hypothetical protein